MLLVTLRVQEFEVLEVIPAAVLAVHAVVHVQRPTGGVEPGHPVVNVVSTTRLAMTGR